jgi:predicted ester cyclase
MSEQGNVRIAERWLESLNAHDLSGFEELRAPGSLFDAPPFPGSVGVDQEIVFTKGIWEAFPDMHFEPRETVAEGDFVVINGVMTGTQNGPMAMPDGRTVPATGKKVASPVSSTFELTNGKIVHQSLYSDYLGMMVQLGLIPGM